MLDAGNLLITSIDLMMNKINGASLFIANDLAMDAAISHVLKYMTRGVIMIDTFLFTFVAVHEGAGLL